MPPAPSTLPRTDVQIDGFAYSTDPAPSPESLDGMAALLAQGSVDGTRPLDMVVCCLETAEGRAAVAQVRDLGAVGVEEWGVGGDNTSVVFLHRKMMLIMF
jgi:hypothetical protein